MNETRLSVLQLVRRLPVVIGFCASFALTFFILTNGYELASGKDIRFTSSLSPVNLSGIIDVSADTAEQYLASSRLGGYGKPVSLRISSSAQKIILVPAQFSQYSTDKHLTARLNAGHYLLRTDAVETIIGNPLIYARKNWRSIGQPETVKLGDNIFIDTDSGWRYMFRVAESTTRTAGEQFVISERPVSTLTLVVEDANSQKQIIISAPYVALQNISR
jgi:hypothetical protein